jgi:2',3'-cyclic-nucleotide 2'-phosphodiesterase/3'-nucleotidase
VRLRTALLLGLLAAAAPARGVERVTVTVLATTDTHGFIYPYDYFTRRPAPRGLAAAATLVEEVRRETPHTLLVDCGDTIQGSPLASVYELGRRERGSAAPGPMMLAMNEVGYDAMVVGNHEFNFGLESLQAARSSARFPWLSANTVTGEALPPFAPYLLKTVAGVKVAVIGITTTAIPGWEKPENIRGLSWIAPEEGVRRALDALEAEKPDVVLAAVHGGLGWDPESGAFRAHEQPGENPAGRIAELFPDLAAVIYGHSHRRDPGRRMGNVLLVQPRPWAMEVARVDLALEREAGGPYRLAGAKSRLLAVTTTTPPAAEVLALARPYHEAAERYLDTEVARSPVALSAERGRFEDSALVDAIHEVQLHYTGAQVSFASLFDTKVRVSRGPVTRRELAALYLYDNELYAIEGDGRMVREALENAARYFRTCPDPSCAQGPLVDRSIAGFNYDTAQGVDYEVDLTRPPGQRVRNLRFRGAALRDEQPLRIALNHYRAAGSAGYSMFRGAKVVWRSRREIRDLMADYFAARTKLPAKPDGNWRLLPPRAVLTLVREEAAAQPTR